MGAKYTFAFKADQVQAAFLSPIFVSFAYRHLIEGTDLHRNDGQVVDLAATAIFLPRHSSVLFYARWVHKIRNGPSVAANFLKEIWWSHIHRRPAGKDIPLQCRCGSLKRFDVKAANDHRSSTLTCRNPACNYAETRSLDGAVRRCEAGEGGIWLVRELDRAGV